MADTVIKRTGGVTEYHSPLLNERYFDFTHKSGVRVLLCPKNSAMTYAVLGTRFGAICTGCVLDGEELKIPAGTAHFLEHKMFDNPGGEKAADGFAAYGAYVNAFTSYDKTAYTFNTAENFPECLEMLIRLVAAPYFTDATVAAEIPIIVQEIRMNADDSYEKCYMEMIRAMYGRGRIRTDICGTEGSLRRITPELLYKCHELFYDPSGLILSVCGNVSPEEIVRVLDKTLPDRSEPPDVIRRARIGRAVRPGRVEIPGNVSDRIFNVGICCKPPKNRRDLLGRDTLLTLTAEAVMSESSDFYGRMIEERKMTPEYSFGATVTDKLAFCSFSGETRDFDGVLAEWRRTVEDIRRAGISAEAFERSRRVIYADYVTSFDSADDISLLMLSSAMDGIGMFDYPEAISNVSRGQAEELVKTEFTPENTAYAVICPAETGGKINGSDN